MPPQKIHNSAYTMFYSDNNSNNVNGCHNYTFTHSEKACDFQNKLTELPRK